MRYCIFSSNLRVKLKLVCFVALMDSISLQYWFQTGKEDRKLRRGEVFTFLTWTAVEIKTKEGSGSTEVVTDRLLMTCQGWPLFPWLHSDLICEIWVVGWDFKAEESTVLRLPAFKLLCRAQSVVFLDLAISIQAYGMLLVELIMKSTLWSCILLE